jgi:hypothetical protein
MEVKTVDTAKKQLESILLDISWGRLARDYFCRSASWIYHKLDGIDGNGGEGDFTDEEKEVLRNALFEISERIRKAAQNFE